MSTDVGACPFCKEILTGQVVADNGLAVALNDAFPAAPGHTLVVPRQHYESLASIPSDVASAMWQLILAQNREQVTGPDNGLNIGLNLGAVAGQTVDHVHVHVIPRSIGDVDDPRGGVRGVLPGRKAPQQSP